MTETNLAVKKIADMAIASVNLPTKTDIPVSALPGDYEISSLERFMKNRTRFRAEVKTKDIATFVRYAVAHKPHDLNPSCFVDELNMSATVIFNMGDNLSPGHGDDKAHLRLVRSSLYESLLNLVNKKLTQKEVAELLEDYSDNFLPATLNSEGELEDIAIKKAIASIRKIKISQNSEAEFTEANFQVQKSAFESIEAKSVETLPSYLKFKCIPFQGLQERTILIRLSILTGGSEPMLTLRIVKYEELTEDMAKEFESLLSEQLVQHNVDVYIGNFNQVN